MVDSLDETSDFGFDSGDDYILEINNLVKHFPVTGGIFNRIIGYVRAVDNVTFKVPVGKTIGVVGESGCGKTTLGRTILRLIEPTSGEIIFNGLDVAKISRKRFRKYRKDMQIIFQDPYASMNPRMLIKNILKEPLEIHKIIPKKQILPYILSIMREVGLDKEHLLRFPHEFSGGQRQRICIARALMVNPDLLVLDEPTASVDVSVQARVLNLLKDIQRNRQLSYIFISHDLSVVTHMSDIVIVMYLGVIVEIGPKDIFSLGLERTHPYSNALSSAIPVPDPDYKKERVILKGDVPSPINPPSGCRFHTRCPLVEEICREKVPELKEVETGHFIACHLR